MDESRWSDNLILRGTPASTPRVCAILLQHPSASWRSKAAEVLSFIGDERCVLPLMQAAETDTEERVQIEAIESLARFGDQQTVRAVLRRLAAKSDNSRVRGAAQNALYRWRHLKSPLVTPISSLIEKCANTLEASDAAVALAERLSNHAREMSNADLQAILTLKPKEFTYWDPQTHVLGGSPHRVTSIYDFEEAKRIAGLELLHRWTLHPYWQWGWLKRFAYVLRHGSKPARPLYIRMTHERRAAWARKTS